MTKGIDYVYIETHSFAAAVEFWKAMGFEVVLDLGTAGRLVHPDDGGAIHLEEIPKDRTPGMQMYLKGDERGAPEGVEVQADWHPSHWGTELLEVKDADGRLVTVQRAGKLGSSEVGESKPLRSSCHSLTAAVYGGDGFSLRYQRSWCSSGQSGSGFRRTVRSSQPMARPRCATSTRRSHREGRLSRSSSTFTSWVLRAPTAPLRECLNRPHRRSASSPGSTVPT